MRKLDDPWSLPDMQDAAVDYVVSECGQPPASLKTPRGSLWVADSSIRCAAALGLNPERLAEIIHSRHIAPVHIRLPFDPSHVHQLPVSEIDSDPVVREKPPGSQVEPEDALSQLLAAENDQLEASERAALIDQIEAGAPLSREQRRTLSLLLRGSSTATRADIVRALLAWLCPNLTIPAYVLQQRRVTLYEPCTLQIIPARRWLDTPHRRLNRQHILLSDSGGYTALIAYAAAVRVRRSRVRVSREPVHEWDVRSLHPKGNAFDDASLRKNLALLAAFVSQDRTSGKDWANTFGETQAMTSWRRSRLNKKLNESTGDKTFVLPGLRTKPDPRKGKSRPRESA